MIDDLIALAGEAVAHAKKLGADAVHAVAADGRSTEISILDGKIEKVEQSEARDISLKVFVGKSSASISGSVLTKDAIHRLAENALRMAQLAPPDPYAGIADPDQLAKNIPELDLAANDLPDPQKLEEIAKRAEAAGMAVTGVTKSSGAGASRSETSVGIVISNGFAQGYRRTGVGVSMSAIAGEGLGMQRDYDYSSAIHYVDLRDEMATNLQNAGFTLERGHHEVGTAGQAEINYKFDTLLRAADDVLLFKYIIKNTAWQAGKTVTFMPKPLFGDNGSGMHAHQSLWKDGKPLFHDESGYAGLSDTARHYIGGILHHAPSLLAFTNPTVNSYKRLVPGYEAPINLVYSQRNRSACVRIPITGNNPKAKRLEFRSGDALANPYIAFAAMLMAGLDGIKNKIEPMAPVDKDLYELPPDELASIPQVPGSLDAVLTALESDNDYLQAGGVFPADLIETWISYKRTYEVDPIRLRPHPHEFELYYDI